MVRNAFREQRVKAVQADGALVENGVELSHVMLCVSFAQGFDAVVNVVFNICFCR